MNKKKPDYTKFMRKPPPLGMSQSSEPGSRQQVRGPVREEEIPWAEIVEECSNPVSASAKPVHPAVVVEDEGVSETAVPHRQALARFGSALTASKLWTAASLAGPSGLPLPAFLIVLVLLLLMI